MTTSCPAITFDRSGERMSIRMNRILAGGGAVGIFVAMPVMPSTSGNAASRSASRLPR